MPDMPDMSEAMADPDPGEMSGMASMDKRLPSLDQFKQRFRDASQLNMPIPKCLNLGTTWGTSIGKMPFQAKESSVSFRDAMRAGLDRGLSNDKAIRLALDASSGQRPGGQVGELTWAGAQPDKPSYEVTTDRQQFSASVRDCLAAGKSVKDAIHDSVCDCRK